MARRPPEWAIIALAGLFLASACAARDVSTEAKPTPPTLTPTFSERERGISSAAPSNNEAHAPRPFEAQGEQARTALPPPLGEGRGEGTGPQATTTSESTKVTQTAADERVEHLLASMTLEEKVGQVFMLGIVGTEAEEETLALIRDLHLGGVILFTRNTQTPAQVRSLAARLQDEARRQPNGVPLFVSIDQEGGMVDRIATGVTLLPGNMALGASGDAGLARSAGGLLGRELAAMGVNMDLAPVVDVNSNPANPVIGVRSFGSSQEQVARLGSAMIEGLQASGVSAVAKHFPGHGDTSVDSHVDLPVVHHGRARLEQVELVPFRAAMAAGVDAIMTAHVFLPALEPARDVPATLSPAVLTRLLRDELGFKGGLVLTDALDMAAIKDRVGVVQGAVEAFRAGSDMLLIAGIQADDLAVRRDAYQALLSAVRSRYISETRLDASVRRVLETKLRRGLIEAVTAMPGLDAVGSRQHAQVAAEVAARAITLVRDESKMLPLGPQQRLLVVRPTSPRSSDAEEQTDTGALGKAVRAVAPSARELVLSVQPTASEVERAAREARTAERVIVASYDAWRWPRQQALIRALLNSGTPTLVVGMRTPYDLLALPEISTYLAAYGDRPVAIQAAVDALFGRAPTPGRLPVELAGLYPLGHGLQLTARP